MNPTSTAKPPELQQSAGASDEVIGIAVKVPSTLRGFVLERALYGAFKAGLDRAGTPAEEWGMVSTEDFICYLARVPRRTVGLRALHQAAEELGIIGIVEIGFRPEPQCRWCGVFPPGAECFDRFFSPENLKASEQRSACGPELVKVLETELAKRLEERMRKAREGEK